MPVEPEHLYVIPPGAYLSVGGGGTLHLSPPGTRDGAAHGARLPFDALLPSLAEAYGTRAACVVLSGTGSDGSAGLRAVRDAGGLVLAQDPAEAGYDGMPRSAIGTGLVDRVAPVAELPGALAGRGRAAPPSGGTPAPEAPASAPDPVLEIIGLLRARTRHDFTAYKRGTLERRIERRMGLLPRGGRTAGAHTGNGTAGGAGRDLASYLALLHGDAAELDQLAKDLLIHVTGFFRDAAAYGALAEHVIPGLLQGRPAGQPVRIWVAGCSTGEEVYSLVILFREAAAALQDGKGQDGRGQDVKLQVFASDIEAEAVATAREGLYAPGIAKDVSAERLARFFSREDDGSYRALPELRASVVFTVQDLLTDPPFSRLDLVSCRNLMIYLGPEAQAKAVALFHFALKQGGALLLGSAETIGEGDGRFELIQKSARLYRHVGRKQPGDLSFAAAPADGLRGGRPGRLPDAVRAPSRQAVLAGLCRQAVLDAHTPAAVLCNARHECLYSLGPTDRYLRVAPGHATPDLLAMARGTLRTRLRSAFIRAAHDGARVTVPGGRLVRDGRSVPFDIDVQPLPGDGEALLLVCFVDAPAAPQGGHGAPAPRAAPRIAELERELEAARAELDEGARTLEASSEEQRAINEEALSVNEEYQSTNEELLTSKEELQSLNEELQALNSQLQETLERQRTTSNDLQNILYSTDVATLFLDRALNIRFFTPATKALFNVIPGDIGRPLADLHSLATDTSLPGDARAVLDSLDPVEREVETPGGTWFRRRILPYRSDSPGFKGAGLGGGGLGGAGLNGSRHDGGVEGVVITFNDITRRKQEAAALEEAKGGAEAANLAKSRFLAAASHDLRQPLQTLALLQGLLARAVTEDKAAGLVRRLDETLGAMSGMLDTLLDLNQIEAGVVRAELSVVRVDGLLDRMREEFTLHAQAKGVALRVMPCSAAMCTDPRLLEQMLRNLLSNALKYTERGRVLLGCRRLGGALRVEVWDTGIGIPVHELPAIFQEYHQVGNEARERDRGLGLGLSIVHRLGALLGHPVHVRSRPGKGSVFTIEAARVADAPPPPEQPGAARHGRRTGALLVIEDDPDLRELLHHLLRDEGHQVTLAPDGPAALDTIRQGLLQPDLVLADYNLPGGLTGLEVAARLREAVPGVPTIILTGDTSVGTLRGVARQDFMQLNKPVRPDDLLRMIQDLLTAPMPAPLPVPPGMAAPAALPASRVAPLVFVVDDDGGIRAALRTVLEEDGCRVEDYPGGEAFLAALGAGRPGRDGCLLVDASMPGMDGLDLLRRLDEAGHRLPAIMITGHGDVPTAVRAMKAGAVDFIEKPVRAPELLASIARALDRSRGDGARSAWHAAAAGSIAGLTQRQRDVMGMVLAGHPSKNIAADLGISQRTVENHRASIMRKTGTRSLPALARLALAAASPGKAPGTP